MAAKKNPYADMLKELPDPAQVAATIVKALGPERSNAVASWQDRFVDAGRALLGEESATLTDAERDASELYVFITERGAPADVIAAMAAIVDPVAAARGEMLRLLSEEPSLAEETAINGFKDPIAPVQALWLHSAELAKDLHAAIKAASKPKKAKAA